MRQPASLLVAVVSLFLSACPEAEPPLNCRALFDCLAACSDSSCEDACIARGTPEGLTAARALATCSDQHSCSTESCLLSSCDSELRTCANLSGTGGGAGGGSGTAGGSTAGGTGTAGGTAGSGTGGGGVACTSGVGVPQVTGALTGLQPAYAAGATIHVTVPVDADTKRAQVTVYQYGGPLQLGSAASEVSGSSVTIDLGAGTMTAPPGTYYLQVDLCSTSLCTSPLTRNVYSQHTNDTFYTEARQTTGQALEVCTTGVPITSFQIQ